MCREPAGVTRAAPGTVSLTHIIHATADFPHRWQWGRDYWHLDTNSMSAGVTRPGQVDRHGPAHTLTPLDHPYNLLYSQLSPDDTHTQTLHYKSRL